MKQTVLLLSIVFVATAAAADEPQTSPPNEPKAEQAQPAAAAELRGEVTSADPEAKLLRLKAKSGDAELGELSLSVEGDGERALIELKAGDTVTVTCREGTSGGTCVATAIEKAKST